MTLLQTIFNKRKVHTISNLKQNVIETWCDSLLSINLIGWKLPRRRLVVIIITHCTRFHEVISVAIHSRTAQRRSQNFIHTKTSWTPRRGVHWEATTIPGGQNWPRVKSTMGVSVFCQCSASNSHALTIRQLYVVSQQPSSVVRSLV